jgi:aminoglycoside phosphotransferase (APT) family kinase protein
MDPSTAPARALKFAGTTPLEDPAQLDLRALERFLGKSVAGFVPPVEARQFRGGQSNPTYLVETGGGRYVLRRRPHGVADASAHSIAREYRVLTALEHSDIPVPRPLALCRDPEVIGSEFYVMEFVDGRLFWDLELPALDPADRAAIYDAMNATLARLHTLDPASVGLSDFGKPAGYVARQLERWTRQYRTAVARPVPAMEKLAAWLPAALPGDEVALIHGDYRLDNIILHPTEPRILAVLDWEMSTLGHPIADLVAHCIAWKLQPGIVAGLAGLDLGSLGIPDETSYIDNYFRRTGRGKPERLDWFFAFGIFRLAAILFGVAARGLQGNATNAAAREFGVAADEIARDGLRIAQRAGCPL